MRPPPSVAADRPLHGRKPEPFSSLLLTRISSIILESLADGGVMMGLPRDVAFELAAQSLQGAARMVLQSGMHPAQLKDSVTTPAGCTIAGILTMEDGKIRSVLARTIQEATRVASSLSHPKKTH